MKLGEIKIEALRLMFANVGEILDADFLSQYKEDERFRDYLDNMPGSINRCFAEIEKRGVLPSKTAALTDGVSNGYSVRFDLSAITDFGTVDRLVSENQWIYDPAHAYRMEGTTLVAECPVAGDRYTLLYKPRLPRVNAGTSEETEIAMPDIIAEAVPYYLKGDLYRDDEPNEASEARNWFEAALDSIPAQRSQPSVRRKYSIGG